MKTLKQLERERKNEIKSLNPSDVEKYLYNLLKGFNIASENYDSDKIEEYQDKIEELILLQRDSNSDLLFNYGRFNSKFSSDLLFFHRRKNDLYFLLMEVFRMINCYQNLRTNFDLLKRLLCFMYFFYKEIDLNLERFYNHAEEVDVITADFKFDLFSEENELIKGYDKIIEGLKISVWFDLDELKSFINLFKDFNVDEVIENIETYVKEAPDKHEILTETDLIQFMEKVVFILEYFKELSDDNVFDELVGAVEGFIDSGNAFEKYSEDFSKDIPSAFKKGVLSKEPEYNLKDCRFVMPMKI